MKSRIIAEKKKSRKEAIVNFVSTSLSFHAGGKMKGNVICAFLAILLMLGGLIFIPFSVHAQPSYDAPVSYVTVNLNSTLITKPPFSTNLTVASTRNYYFFYAYIDVISTATAIGAYSVGFTFNQAYLQIKNVTDGGFLNSVSGATTTGLTGAGSSVIAAANGVGEIDSLANAVEFNGYDVPAPIGSGVLLKVGFNTTKFSPPYTGSYPGTFVNMIHLNVSSYASYQTQIFSNDTTDVSPAQSGVYSGYFKMYVTPTLPVASFAMTPPSPNIYNTTSGVENFNGSSSTAGSLGYTPPTLSISYYCWNFGDGSKLNTTNPETSHTYTAPPSLPSVSTYTVTLIVNNTGGVYSNAVSQSLIVEYSKTSKFSVSISPVTATLDIGQSQLYTSSVSGGTSPYSYQWYLDGAAVSSATAASWTFTSSSTGVYSVYMKVTDANHLVATSNSATVTVNPALSVAITPTSAIMDVGQSRTFIATITPGTFPFSYQWYLNGASVSGATNPSWTFTSSSSGNYSVYVNVEDNVGAKAKSNVALVNVNPTPSVSVSPTFTSIAFGYSQTFTSVVSGGTSPYSYHWYLNGSVVSGATGPTWTFTPVSIGAYAVYLNVTDNVGKMAISNVAIVTVYFSQGWPMFRQGLTHTGYSTSTAPVTSQILWGFMTSKGVDVTSSPAMANGKIYVGSCDGSVYALDASTGASVWNYTTGGAVESSPAVANGVVYVGSCDGSVYALNASTGLLLWYCMVGWPVESSPAVSNGVVYVASWDEITGNGMINALNASTGIVFWVYSTPGYSPTNSSPAVANGIVYVGGGDGRVYALNATTSPLSPQRRQLWNYTTGGAVESSPAVANGVVYVGSTDNRTYALNASTGQQKWIYVTGGSVLSSPAVAGGIVYVGSNDGRVYALRASTGVPLWDHLTHGAVESSPAVAGGMVFIGSDDGNVYALNASSGALIWSYATGGMVESSPAVSNGVVYVGSCDGKVYAFGQPPYNVTVTAYSITGCAGLNVPISMDGTPTGFKTPYTFVGLTGTHMFTVPNTNGTQLFKQWNTGETTVTVTVSSGVTETAYYRTLHSVDASGTVGISGYKLVFMETLNNSLSSNENITYYWSFTLNKWNGTRWVATKISGSSTHLYYALSAMTTETLRYYVFVLNSSAVKWGDWLKVSYTFYWTYSSTYYSIGCVAKLNVHPGDIAGAAQTTFPYLGADGKVNIADVMVIAMNWNVRAVGASPTSKLGAADINGDGKVNIQDLMIIAYNWGQTWTNTPPPG